MSSALDKRHVAKGRLMTSGTWRLGLVGPPQVRFDRPKLTPPCGPRRKKPKKKLVVEGRSSLAPLCGCWRLPRNNPPDRGPLWGAFPARFGKQRKRTWTSQFSPPWTRASANDPTIGIRESAGADIAVRQHRISCTDLSTAPENDPRYRHTRITYPPGTHQLGQISGLPAHCASSLTLTHHATCTATTAQLIIVTLLLLTHICCGRVTTAAPESLVPASVSSALS